MSVSVNTPLETTHLSKRYGHTWALQDCTLALPAGRVAALVGPNGAPPSGILDHGKGPSLILVPMGLITHKEKIFGNVQIRVGGQLDHESIDRIQALVSNESPVAGEGGREIADPEIIQRSAVRGSGHL